MFTTIALTLFIITITTTLGLGYYYVPDPKNFLIDLVTYPLRIWNDRPAFRVQQPFNWDNYQVDPSAWTSTSWHAEGRITPDFEDQGRYETPTQRDWVQEDRTWQMVQEEEAHDDAGHNLEVRLRREVQNHEVRLALAILKTRLPKYTSEMEKVFDQDQELWEKEKEYNERVEREYAERRRARTQDRIEIPEDPEF